MGRNSILKNIKGKSVERWRRKARV